MNVFFVAGPLQSGLYWGELPSVLEWIGFAVALTPVAAILANLHSRALRQVALRWWADEQKGCVA